MTKRRHHEPDPTPPAAPVDAAASDTSGNSASGNSASGNSASGEFASGDFASGSYGSGDGAPVDGFPYDPDAGFGNMGAEPGEPVAAVEAEVPSVEEVLRRERDEAQEKSLRLLAELDNVRKRARREVVDARRFAQADVLRGFLDILDNLERALQTNGAAADTGAPDPLRAGIELTRQKFRSVLQEQGVTPIEALGLYLDPLVHEAVGQLPREGSEPGTIIEVAQAGYRLGELVLRPARVIICA